MIITLGDALKNFLKNYKKALDFENQKCYISDVKTKKDVKMNALLNQLQKKVITEEDRRLADDYLTYYGIQPGEEFEYADEFVSVCYKYNEETCEHEIRMPSELPFADVEYLSDHLVKYTYGNCSEIKPVK